MKPFVSAMRTLTAIPVRGKECEKIENALYAFPVVGALLGILVWFVAGVGYASLPVGVAAALALTAQTLLTRGFHLDGVADAADGFGGGFTKEHSLEIMKDSRIGAFGAIALALTLLIKFSLFSAVLKSDWGGAIYAAMIISRTAMVFLCVTMNYARPDGTAAASVQNARCSHLLVALLLALLLVPLGGIEKLFLLPVCLIAAFLWGRYCKHRVGGITGDLLGAGNELVEIVVLIGVLLI